MTWLLRLVLSVTLVGGLVTPAHGEETSYDLVIYGGTSAGIAAAVQGKRMGLSVLVIEPSTRIGGLTTGGLGQTDIGNKAVIGGIAREFYRDIAKHYQQAEAWKWQSLEQYRSGGQSRTAAGEATMWTFEPHAALKVYQDWIDRESIPVVYAQRLDRRSGVAMTRSRPARILALRMESGETYRGKMFIDATYEGDLMATAGVSWTLGREANAQYGETLNGVQTQQAKSHQLRRGIDPYVVAGDPGSGWLPHIDPAGPGEEGSADHRIQAYCFRMCLTDHPENQIPFHQPEGYDPLWYELLLRNFEAGERSVPWINLAMPNRKTDTNNRLGFSTDFIGQNYEYPTASYEAREQIVARHLLYQQGLMWTLANHPRVPDSVRQQVSKWGLCKDEFTAGNGWQSQLYIREARRMVGDYVMTQKNCQGLAVEDPVGMAAYTMDSHNQQRYVDEQGHVRNEGDVQVGGFPPYGISYRAILPQREEVSNLSVPVCLSASHIAFGSIRMEPVFMVLGQSAATAAALAIANQQSLHQVDYEKLRERLLADQQVLQYQGAKPAVGIAVKSLEGIVIDNTQAETIGNWVSGNTTTPFVGTNYLHDNDTDKGHCSVRFSAELPAAGRYTVRIAWPKHANRATNTRVRIYTADEPAELVLLNQQAGDPAEPFLSVGTFAFDKQAKVEIENAGSDGYVIADAVQFLAAKADSTVAN